MKIVFSRKGFDSASGGGPSPIIDGRARSLPIPEYPAPEGPWPTYESRNLGEHLDRAGSAIQANTKCHDDPMFAQGWCWFGQCGAAQSHLEKQGVGKGDVFVFFGLFRDTADRSWHHRIFGYMLVKGQTSPASFQTAKHWRPLPGNRPHPHFSNRYPANNCIWFGHGANDAPASQFLRLTALASKKPSLWRIESWLAELRMSYHQADWRWEVPGLLQTVGRGQEFVCDIGERADARAWLEKVIEEIEAPNPPSPPPARPPDSPRG